MYFVPALSEAFLGLQPVGHPLYGLVQFQKQLIPVTEYLSMDSNKKIYSE